MKKFGWFSHSFATLQCVAGGAALALLALMTSTAAAQNAATDAQTPAAAPMSIPTGYSIHESVDMGGRMAGISGSGAMYDTMVNLKSGPRELGESFELHALPSTKRAPLDDLHAFASGFGGDPNNFAKLDFSKSKYYEFSGTFRRDRQYFDYDLLGNPNIPSGQSIPIGPTGAPTGALPWSQVRDSPFLFNTVRRMTDTNLTLLPLSKVTFRVGYSQNVMQGPSLTPSGYQIAGSYDILLREMQRNSTDDFTGAIDWKPVQGTKLTFEEQLDHYKGNSYFTADPSYFNVQEADGTPVALLANYDSLTPYASSACNTTSMGTAPMLSATNTPGGLPVINAACAVLSSYSRTQATRVLFPTEMFRLQSSSVRNVELNGDVRYTNAKMNLPSYYDSFQGLAKATRSSTYTGYASGRREVMAADFGIVWQVAKKVAIEDQITFSSFQQPGWAIFTSGVTLSVPTTAGNETITYAGTLTPTTASVFEGSPGIGVIQPDFLGQRKVNNDFTLTWDATDRSRFSLTYRYGQNDISEGPVHSGPVSTSCPALPGGVASIVGQCGTVPIDENGGIFTAALRPTPKWNLNGSVEAMYNDNSFTPMGFRQMRHYRVHTIYRPETWATVSGAFNDIERHNNTNNTGTPSVAGPLDHVDYSRNVSIGTELFPNERYGLDFDYSYNDAYMADNICYLGGASAATGIAAAAPANGAVCPGSLGRSGSYDFGPVSDFEHAPTQFGSVAFMYSPEKQIHSNLGYRISSVNGTRFYNDARDVAGSLVSTYESPYVNFSWESRPGLVWKADYNFFGYGEGGPSGAQYCTFTNPTTTSPVSVVPCSSAGVQTGMNISPAGETAPRNFHANNVVLGVHYEF